MIQIIEADPRLYRGDPRSQEIRAYCWRIYDGWSAKERRKRARAVSGSTQVENPGEAVYHGRILLSP